MKTHCHLCLVDGACAQYGHEATLTTSSQHIDERPDVILLYDSIGLQAYRASAKHTICVFFWSNNRCMKLWYAAFSRRWVALRRASIAVGMCGKTATALRMCGVRTTALYPSRFASIAKGTLGTVITQRRTRLEGWVKVEQGHISQ